MGIPVRKPIERPGDDLDRSDVAVAGLDSGPRLSSVNPASVTQARAVARDDFDLWKDVFVHQPLPWARLTQSAVLHVAAQVGFYLALRLSHKP